MADKASVVDMLILQMGFILIKYASNEEEILQILQASPSQFDLNKMLIVT